jgi:hypothetical protein
MAVKKKLKPAKPSAPPSPQTWSEFFHGLLRRSGRALAEWAVHTLLVFAIFGLIQALHYGMIHVLGIPADKRFFGEVPLEWLMDAADLFLIVSIGVVGVIAAIRSYMGLH